MLSKCCTSLCGFKQKHVVIWLLLIEEKKSRSVSNEYSEKYIHFKKSEQMIGEPQAVNKGQTKSSD